MIGKFDKWGDYSWTVSELESGGKAAVFTNCPSALQREVYVTTSATYDRTMAAMTIDEAKQLHQALGEAIAHAESKGVA